MAGDTVVMVRAGKVVFAVITSFVRIPTPGEHIFLSLTDAQRSQLGAEFGYGHSKNCVPAIVRDTVLRQKDLWRKNVQTPWTPSAMMEDHVADLFVEAITTDGWTQELARWGAGDR